MSGSFGKAPVNKEFTSFGREKTGYQPPKTIYQVGPRKQFSKKGGTSRVGGGWMNTGVATTMKGNRSKWTGQGVTGKTDNPMKHQTKTPYGATDKKEGGFMSVIKPKEEKKQEVLTPEDIEALYNIMDPDNLEEEAYQVHRTTCWNVVQPAGFANKPTAKLIKGFTKHCEILEANVISSMLFYYMIDTDAHFRTRLRAIYASEALCKKWKNYHTFYVQNEKSLDMIDIDLMKSENSGAGREVVRVLKSLKDLLSREFGQKKKEKHIDVLKIQQNIHVEKKKSAHNFFGNNKASNSENNEEIDLLGNTPTDNNPPQKSFGFVKSGNQAPEHSTNLLDEFTNPVEQQVQEAKQELGGLLDLGLGEPTQAHSSPQTHGSNDFNLLGSEPIQNTDNNDYDLLSGYSEPKPAPKKKDPFNFLN